MVLLLGVGFAEFRGFYFLLFSLFSRGVELCRGEGNDMVLKIGAVKQQMKINLGRLEKLS